RKENKKERVRNHRPQVEMRSVQLSVNDNAQRNETDDYGCGNEPVAQPDAGQPFRAAVIFSDCLKRNAPPEVSVNLDVPFVPAGIDRVAPAFFLEQLENRAEQMVAISSLVAPKNPASQSATRFRVGRQMFVRANDAARRAFEMEPGEVTRKSPHQRLEKSQAHYE